jgi:hypothetical protein
MSMPAERRISGQVKEESTAAPTNTLLRIAERLSDLGDGYPYGTNVVGSSYCDPGVGEAECMTRS